MVMWYVCFFFSLNLFETVDFATNVNAYQIKDDELPSSLFIIEVQDLLMSSILHIYKQCP